MRNSALDRRKVGKVDVAAAQRPREPWLTLVLAASFGNARGSVNTSPFVGPVYFSKALHHHNFAHWFSGRKVWTLKEGETYAETNLAIADASAISI